MGSFAEEARHPMVETSAPPPITPSLLPPSTSPSISLVPATLLERYQCWHINSHSWRGPLSVAQYLKREACLEGQLLTRNGKITYWILTDTSLPCGKDGVRQILASCESLRKNGYIAVDGHLEEVVTHGIGSVFCRVEYCGRGYASRMMADLGATLETWQQPRGSRALFSMLWSDIGPSFYARHGWEAMKSTHISLPPVSEDGIRQSCNLPELARLRNLAHKDLQLRVCPKAIAEVEAELRQRSKKCRGLVHIAVRPDYDHMSWHHAREEFQAKTLYNVDLAVKGAEDAHTGCAIIWSRSYGETLAQNKLHILHTLIPYDAPGDVRRSLETLLLRAQQEAAICGMSAVELWSPEAAVIDAAQTLAGAEELKISVRDKESICSLRWARGDRKEVEWVANEKYAWC